MFVRMRPYPILFQPNVETLRAGLHTQQRTHCQQTYNPRLPSCSKANSTTGIRVPAGTTALYAACSLFGPLETINNSPNLLSLNLYQSGHLALWIRIGCSSFRLCWHAWTSNRTGSLRPLTLIRRAAWVSGCAAWPYVVQQALNIRRSAGSGLQSRFFTPED
jgi:hypothetical protein